MNAVVAVPYRDIGCPFRSAAWTAVRHHLDALGFPIVLVDDGGELFSRAGSLNLAFEQSDADVVVACDADLLVELEALESAVDAAADPGLVLPFDRLHYLDLAGRVQYRWRACEETPLFGGCNVLSRETWERSGGWDAGYRGWGCEDVAMWRACEKVAPTRRVSSTAIHLFHPKAGDYASESTVAANGERMRR